MSADRQPSPGIAKIGIVTGLAAEARLISSRDTPDSRIEVLCAGANSIRAMALAEQLVAKGAAALVSFGIAGALDPRLGAGDLIFATGIIGPDETRHPCDQPWGDDIMHALSGRDIAAQRGRILGSPRALLSIEDKAGAFAASGCLAVDMESHAVAAVAAEAGLPFLAIRSIADTAQDALPTFVVDAVNAEGKPDTAKALRALLRRPWQLPAALRLARRTDAALSVLKELGREPALLFRGCG